mgnify:CR=1 FL=1
MSVESQTKLHWKGLRKRLGTRDVLRGATGSLASGEVVAILGRNGAGKTTLVRILATLEGADQGEVRVAPARGGARETALRQRVGFLPHEPPLTPALTVGENLEFQLACEGPARSSELDAARSALARWGVADRWSQVVRTLSRGQAQRVSLAALELAERPLRLLDEPFTALDSRTASGLIAAVRRWRTEGVGVLFVTHDLGLADQLADRILVLRRGQTFDVPDAVRHSSEARTRMEAALEDDDAPTSAV